MTAAEFLEKASAANLSDGSIISRPPASFRPDPGRDPHWRRRLEHILAFCRKKPYAAGEYLRVLAFERLLEVRNLKFALAHVGNPWYDEYILRMKEK